MKLVTVSEMQAIEREANEQGWTYEQMMEKAGQGLAEIVHSFYGYEDTNLVIGLVGSGNNGGDTLIALETLARSGWKSRAYLVLPRLDRDPLIQRLIEAGGEICKVEEDADLHRLGEWVVESTVLLDGVFGTGIHLPLRGEAVRVLSWVKQCPERPPVVAVDCPSGVDLESGKIAEETIPADLTVCMAAVKAGLLKFPAYQMAGELHIVDIGLPENLSHWIATSRNVITDEIVRSILPERKPDSHKGTFGTVGVIAGSLNYCGAALLCSRAAHKVGAGLVQVAVPGPVHAVIAGQFPEATWVLLPSDLGVIADGAASVLVKYLDRVSVLLWGPGFGVEDTTASFVRRMLLKEDMPSKTGGIGFLRAASDKGTDPITRAVPPMVIDADGLKLMARIPGWHEILPKDCVLTPHPGEMSILTGLNVYDIQSDRVEVAGRFAKEWGHVVVLKGAITVVAGPDGRIGVVPIATSALAHAGSGDVLAGIIAGLRAQGMQGFEAAIAGSWLHAQSGLLAAEQLGHEASVLAGDLIDVLPEVLSWVW